MQNDVLEGIRNNRAGKKLYLRGRVLGDDDAIALADALLVSESVHGTDCRNGLDRLIVCCFCL